MKSKANCSTRLLQWGALMLLLSFVCQPQVAAGGSWGPSLGQIAKKIDKKSKSQKQKMKQKAKEKANQKIIEQQKRVRSNLCLWAGLEMQHRSAGARVA